MFCVCFKMKGSSGDYLFKEFLHGGMVWISNEFTLMRARALSLSVVRLRNTHTHKYTNIFSLFHHQQQCFPSHRSNSMYTFSLIINNLHINHTHLFCLCALRQRRRHDACMVIFLFKNRGGSSHVYIWNTFFFENYLWICFLLLLLCCIIDVGGIVFLFLYSRRSSAARD